MSLLNVTIAITGSITVIAMVCIITWLFYTLIKVTFEEPDVLNILALITILCIFVFGSCMAYINYTEKDTKEYQQYLDLKAKYEKEIK